MEFLSTQKKANRFTGKQPGAQRELSWQGAYMVLGADPMADHPRRPIEFDPAVNLGVAQAGGNWLVWVGHHDQVAAALPQRIHLAAPCQHAPDCHTTADERGKKSRCCCRLKREYTYTVE